MQFSKRFQAPFRGSRLFQTQTTRRDAARGGHARLSPRRLGRRDRSADSTQGTCGTLQTHSGRTRGSTPDATWRRGQRPRRGGDPCTRHTRGRGAAIRGRPRCAWTERPQNERSPRWPRRQPWVRPGQHPERAPSARRSRTRAAAPLEG
eukprot:Amastigsp_a888124_2.p2 type:complete len:149 gc:universal Amastigsp_a888124_2:493-47(-)